MSVCCGEEAVFCDHGPQMKIESTQGKIKLRSSLKKKPVSSSQQANLMCQDGISFNIFHVIVASCIILSHLFLASLHVHVRYYWLHINFINSTQINRTYCTYSTKIS